MNRAAGGGGGGGAGAAFKKGLCEKLGEVERFALQEVQRLNEALAKVQAENHDLRSQLEGGKSVVLICHQSKDSKDFECGVSATNLEDSTSSRNWHRPVSPLFASEEESWRGSQQDSKWTAESASESKDLRFLSLPGDNGPAHRRCRRTSRSSNGSSRAHTPLTQVSRVRGFAKRVLSWPYFEQFSLFFVILNAVWVGVDLDLNGKPLLQSPPLHQVIEHSFVVLFLSEFLLRALACKKVWTALRDRWLVFDGVLAMLMVLDSWLLTLVILISGRYDVSSFGLFAVPRILRLFRVVRIVRICRVVPELELMVSSIVAGMRSVMITSMILLAMTYSFAVVLRQLSSSTQVGDDHFRTVPSSVYTLLTQSILPDHSDLLNEIMDGSRVCGAIYFIFLLLAVIMVVNMLIALLCDVVGNTSQEEKENRNIQTMSEKLEAFLRSADEDYDGVVSKSEFERILDNGEAMRLLRDVGVDVDALVDDAEFIFQQRGDQALTFDDFKEEALQFRHTSHATMGAITATRRFIRLSLEQIAGRIADIEAVVTRAHGSRSECEGGAQRLELPELRGVRQAADCARYGELLNGISRLWTGDPRRGPPEILE